MCLEVQAGGALDRDGLGSDIALAVQPRENSRELDRSHAMTGRARICAAAASDRVRARGGEGRGARGRIDVLRPGARLAGNGQAASSEIEGGLVYAAVMTKRAAAVEGDRATGAEDASELDRYHGRRIAGLVRVHARDQLGARMLRRGGTVLGRCRGTAGCEERAAGDEERADDPLHHVLLPAHAGDRPAYCRQPSALLRLQDEATESPGHVASIVPACALAGQAARWQGGAGRGATSVYAINGAGAVLTAVALAVELISKFAAGAWLVVVVVPLLVLMFSRIHAAYDRIGAQLQIGQRPPPPPPRKSSSLVVVPVGGMPRLTVAAISAALSLGDEVVAVTVCFADSEDTEVDAHFRDQWDAWHPNVPLVTLSSAHRALAPPIVDYLRKAENEDRYHRLVVLIADVQAARPWQRILYNQRGFVLDRAIQRGTVNVIICRLHFKLSAMSGKH